MYSDFVIDIYVFDVCVCVLLYLSTSPADVRAEPAVHLMKSL